MKIAVSILLLLSLLLGVPSFNVDMLEKELYESREVYWITGYCSCEICCGKWSLNRPDGIIYTSSQDVANSEITVAADWSILPSGTVIYIEGVGQRIVQDEGGSVKGKHIDVYFDTHKEAEEFGVQRLYVIILGMEVGE